MLRELNVSWDIVVMIKNSYSLYASIATALYALLVVFAWIEDCKEAFLKLKEYLNSTPILQAPNWDKVFHVHIDASNFVINCILA